jgi:hypothetical protein
MSENLDDPCEIKRHLEEIARQWQQMAEQAERHGW